MYIGTDLQEKSGLTEVMDKLDFSLYISMNSIPYLDRYGVDIAENEPYFKDKIPFIFMNLVKNLNINELTLNEITIDSKNKKIYLTLNYMGQTLTTSMEI